jgi:hypothetical protein
MEKIPTKKAVSLIGALKGKKPVVIIACIVIFIVGIFAAKKGYISEDLLDVNAIVGFVDSALASDTTQAAVDTTVQVIDSLPK